MKVYACLHCGDVFDGVLPKVREAYGEIRDLMTCRVCNCSDYVEATKCKICGEWFGDYNGREVCDDCMMECATVENALSYGENNKVNVKVNELVTAILSEEQINTILTNYIRMGHKSYGMQTRFYCFDDKRVDDFAEHLIERAYDGKVNILR